MTVRCTEECSEMHTFAVGECEAAVRTSTGRPYGPHEPDSDASFRDLQARVDARLTDSGDGTHPSAHDLGLRDGVDDSCVHGRSVWSCPLCDAGRLSELVALWGRDRAAAASCRRSVRMVWPELAERLDDLLDQQDGGGETGGNHA